MSPFAAKDAIDAIKQIATYRGWSKSGHEIRIVAERDGWAVSAWADGKSVCHEHAPTLEEALVRLDLRVVPE